MAIPNTDPSTSPTSEQANARVPDDAHVEEDEQPQRSQTSLPQTPPDRDISTATPPSRPQRARPGIRNWDYRSARQVSPSEAAVARRNARRAQTGRPIPHPRSTRYRSLMEDIMNDEDVPDISAIDGEELSSSYHSESRIGPPAHHPGHYWSHPVIGDPRDATAGNVDRIKRRASSPGRRTPFKRGKVSNSKGSASKDNGKPRHDHDKPSPSAGT